MPQIPQSGFICHNIHLLNRPIPNLAYFERKACARRGARLQQFTAHTQIKAVALTVCAHQIELIVRNNHFCQLAQGLPVNAQNALLRSQRTGPHPPARSGHNAGPAAHAPAAKAQMQGGKVKATIGAWQISCGRPAGSKIEKCAAVQSVTAEDRPNVGLTVIFQKSIADKKQMLLVVAPLGVLLADGTWPDY